MNRLFFIFIAFIFISQTALADYYQSSNRAYNNPRVVSYTSFGNSTLSSDGVMYTRYGASTHGSDGSVYTTYGNTITGIQPQQPQPIFVPPSPKPLYPVKLPY